jgi:hypothetical protein
MSTDVNEADYNIIVQLRSDDQSYSCMIDIWGYISSNPKITFQNLFEIVTLESNEWQDFEYIYKISSVVLFRDMKEFDESFKKGMNVREGSQKKLKACFNQKLYPDCNWPAVIYFKLEKFDGFGDAIIPVPAPIERSDDIECLRRLDENVEQCTQYWSENIEHDLNNCNPKIPVEMNFEDENHPRKYRCNLTHLYGGLSSEMVHFCNGGMSTMKWEMGKFNAKNFKTLCSEGLKDASIFKVDPMNSEKYFDNNDLRAFNYGLFSKSSEHYQLAIIFRKEAVHLYDSLRDYILSNAITTHDFSNKDDIFIAFLKKGVVRHSTSSICFSPLPFSSSPRSSAAPVVEQRKDPHNKTTSNGIAISSVNEETLIFSLDAVTFPDHSLNVAKSSYFRHPSRSLPSDKSSSHSEASLSVERKQNNTKVDPASDKMVTGNKTQRDLNDAQKEQKDRNDTSENKEDLNDLKKYQSDCHDYERELNDIQKDHEWKDFLDGQTDRIDSKKLISFQKIYDAYFDRIARNDTHENQWNRSDSNEKEQRDRVK